MSTSPASAIVLLAWCVASAATANAQSGVTGSFQGVNMSAVNDEPDPASPYEPNKRVIDVSGKARLENGKGDTVAEGELFALDGRMAVRAKKGASFEHEPVEAKVVRPVWAKDKPATYAQVSFDGKRTFVVEDAEFVFLFRPSGFGSVQILMPESLLRATVLTVPEGTFQLFGYQVKASKAKATVKFARGEVVETAGCEVTKAKREK